VSSYITAAALLSIYTYTCHDTKGHSRRDSSNLLKFEAPVRGVPSQSGPIDKTLYN
jgi:hypothetical protein